MRKLLVLVVLVSIAEAAVAQSFYAIRKNRSLIAVVGAGTATYFGELSNPGDYFDAKPNINVGLQYYLNTQISVRSEINWFVLQGSDAQADDNSRKRRNLSFKSNNIEFNAVGMINLFANGNRYYRRPYFNVYGFGGVGLLYFNPKAEINGKWHALQPLQTEGVKYSRITPTIPFGLGFRVKSGPNLNVAFEVGYRKIFTDYLDDVSTVYPVQASLSSDLARSLSVRYNPVPADVEGLQRGNPSSVDGYMMANVKLEYYLPFDLHDNGNGRMYSRKRSASYRYNKRGGLRR
ncbi:MAG: outer membrane beta-barrel protein [Cyclobacteriaceae bacterium]|nr:outer membrane beta-barrel protein [Cyclobacteriaceae bacterium]